MENDDKDDGYTEEVEGEQCPEFSFTKVTQFRSMVIDGYENTAADQKITPDALFDYANSSGVCYRATAARQLCEALESAISYAEAYSEQVGVEKVFDCVRKLAEDIETSVRCIVVKSLPKVAVFCASFDSPLISLKHYVESTILPIVLKAIADEDKRLNMRVRKEGYAALKKLQEANLVDQEMIENNILAISLDLLYEASFQRYIVAGNFLAKMAPVVGEAATEKLLLPEISDFCTNDDVSVREACVFFLIDIACHVNSLITENIIVPLFIKLCEDDVAAVRLACVETIVILSCLCLMESRKTVLSQAFVKFIVDAQTYQPACRQLGAFITTFAQPAITALGCSCNGDYLLMSDNGSIFQFASPNMSFQYREQEKSENSFSMLFVPMESESEKGANTAVLEWPETTNEDVANGGTKDAEDLYNNNNDNNEESLLALKAFWKEFCDFKKNETLTDANSNPIDGDSATATHLPNVQYENQPDLVQSCLQKPLSAADATNLSSTEIPLTENTYESPDSFNSFQYWRDPIPEFSELDMGSHGSTNRFRKSYRTVKRKKSLPKQPCFPRTAVLFPDFIAKLEPDAMIECNNKQYVIPRMLIEAFECMSQMSRIEMKMYCAHSFPAVMLTVGRQNWPLLKNMYSKLASDPEKKLRELIARSIHEIALILGSELTTEDLIPVYNSLINDVEDVRVIALNHLSCFVKLLKPNCRCMFLPHLTDYMMIDYSWNWRFRKQLSEQLIEMMDYFAPNDCWKFVSPVAFALLMDRVAAVRLQALSLVTNLIRVVSADITLLRGILAELAEQFAHSTQWARRQSFAFLCASLMQTPVLPDEMFARDILPHLLDLSWDSIPNVRIAVARTLSSNIITHPYFSNVGSPHYDVLMQVLKRLCKDEDRDVQYFASLNALPQFDSFDSRRTNWNFQAEY